MKPFEDGAGDHEYYVTRCGTVRCTRKQAGALNLLLASKVVNSEMSKILSATQKSVFYISKDSCWRSTPSVSDQKALFTADPGSWTSTFLREQIRQFRNLTFVVELDGLDENLAIIESVLEIIVDDVLPMAADKKKIEVVVTGALAGSATQRDGHIRLFAFCGLARLAIPIQSVRMVNVPTKFTKTLTQSLRNAGWGGTVEEASVPYKGIQRAKKAP